MWPAYPAQVHSEETVLYTAQHFVDNPHVDDRRAAARKLAPLIRCPHLSVFWLSMSVMSEKAHRMLLFSQRAHVQRLLLLRLAEQKQPAGKPEDLQQLLQGAPESWWLKQRVHKPVQQVELTWELDVERLKTSAILSATEDRAVTLDTGAITPPFRGIAWTIYANCYRGQYIGLHMKLNTWVPDLYCRTSCTLTVPCPVHGNKTSTFVSPLQCNKDADGSQGLFPKGMAGGWNDGK